MTKAPETTYTVGHSTYPIETFIGFVRHCEQNR